MKILLVMLFIMMGCEQQEKSSKSSKEPSPSSGQETEAREQELNDEDSSSEENEDHSEDHLNSQIDGNDEIDLRPTIELKGKFKLVKGFIDNPNDLEPFEVGIDYHGNCYVFKSDKGIRVRCAKSPCSILEQRFLQSWYVGVYIASKRDKRITFFRRNRAFRRQRAWESCMSSKEPNSKIIRKEDFSEIEQKMFAEFGNYIER